MVALRHVRVEVMFSLEGGTGVEFAAEEESRTGRKVDTIGIENWECARKGKVSGMEGTSFVRFCVGGGVRFGE